MHLTLFYSIIKASFAVGSFGMISFFVNLTLYVDMYIIEGLPLYYDGMSERTKDEKARHYAGFEPQSFSF